LSKRPGQRPPIRNGQKRDVARTRRPLS
jgi:hypothetical protein